MLDNPRPVFLRSPLLARAEAAGIRHGFFTRKGGVSEGIYESLNVGLGSADETEPVCENRRRVALAMGVTPAALATLFQVHSPDVVNVSAPFAGESRPRADALVTARPGLALGVLTADCAPVLFADPEAGVIGAAHAGWKGALSGVLENTVAAMEDLGAGRAGILAALGPAISAANYEVGPEFVERFHAAEPSNARFFRPSGRQGHALFDLGGYVLARLSAAGIAADHVARCTYADDTAFYSYRRAMHRGESDYGRQISAIALEGR